MTSDRQVALRYLTCRSLFILAYYLFPVSLTLTGLQLGFNSYQLTLVTIARTLPLVLALPLSGLAIDRYSPKFILVICNVIACCSLVGISLDLWDGVLKMAWMVFALVLTGFAAAPVLPSFLAMLPRLIPEGQLVRVNAIQSFIAGLCSLLGPVLATTMIYLHPSSSFVMMAFFVAGSALVALLLPHVRSEKNASRDLFEDFKEGCRVVLHQRWILIVVIWFACLNLAFSGFQGVVAPIVFSDNPGLGSRMWGIACVVSGLGMLGASALMVCVKPKRPLLLGLSLSICAAFPALILWVWPNVWMLFFAFFLAGFGLEVFTICWTSALQVNVSEYKLGRVAALDAFGSYLGAPVGVAVFGVLYGNVGPGLLPIIGVLLLFSSVSPLLSSEVRNIPGFRP